MSATPPAIGFGFEYTVSPDGNVDPINGGLYPGSSSPLTWSTTTIGTLEPVPIGSNHTLSMRYRQVIQNVDGISFNYTYPDWELVSQTIECISHGDPNPFANQLDTEVYEPATPGVYGVDIAVATLKSEAEYSYPKVFDQSVFNWIEPLSPWDSSPRGGDIPTEPYDPPELYPIDAITKYKPDMRRVVTVTYRVTTQYKINNGATQTETVTVSQPVRQNMWNWSGVVKQYVDRSHFGNGYRPQKPLS